MARKSERIDLRIDAALVHHPKVKRLHRLTDGAGFFCLIALWSHARVHKPSGDLTGMTDEDIEDAAAWVGEPGVLVAALVAARWLDGPAGARQIHDWGDHQPWAVGSPERTLQAQWAAAKRHHGTAAADERVPEWAAIRHARAAADSGDDANANGVNSDPDTGNYAQCADEECGPDAERMRDASPRSAPSPFPFPFLQSEGETRARDGDAPPKPASPPLRVVNPPRKPMTLPPVEGIPADLVDAFTEWRAHWADRGEWSAPREMMAVKQVQALLRMGRDVKALLGTALMRGRRDLLGHAAETEHEGRSNAATTKPSLAERMRAQSDEADDRTIIDADGDAGPPVDYVDPPPSDDVERGRRAGALGP